MSGIKPSGSQDQASDGQFEDVGTSAFKNPKAGIWIRRTNLAEDITHATAVLI